jgi:small subunit ribosomal protein S16
MSVRIRLQRHGRKQTPLYHIVIADARAPRDGSFIERIGVYNPMTRPATIEIDRMKAYQWLTNGAQPTETVRSILRFKGVLFYKHLQRGVSKGAMTPEEAEIKFRAWVDEKEAKIQERVKATQTERKERAAQISGSVRTVKKKKVEEEPQDELLNVDLAEKAAAETAEDVETKVPVTEAPAVEAESAASAEETVAPEAEATPAETEATPAETEATPEETEATPEETEKSEEA